MQIGATKKTGEAFGITHSAASKSAQDTDHATDIPDSRSPDDYDKSQSPVCHP
ncbi:MAG: hypothetical protein U9N06_06645 [candidate division WOR-3 bacterium]|nr:hypothetical protein [candidate division WOR-3 bacterium]